MANIIIVFGICIALFSCKSRSSASLSERATSMAGSKPQVLVIVADELTKLRESDCFKDWLSNLEENWTVNVVYNFSPNLNDPAADYRHALRSFETPRGVIVVGQVAMPMVMLPKFSDTQMNDTDTYPRHLRRQASASFVALSNSGIANFPSFAVGRIDDETRVGEREFFSGIDTWFGFISGGNIQDPARSIELYCRYFTRNTRYRTCNKSERFRVSTFRGPDFSDPSDQSTRVLVADDMDSLGNNYPHFECKEDCIYKDDFHSLRDMLTQSIDTPVDFTRLAAHSSETCHINESISVDEVIRTQPRSNFYSLYACKSGQPIASGVNLAEAYLLHSPETIAVIAPTISAGSQETLDYLFHAYLRDGYPFGEALLMANTQRYRSSFRGHSHFLRRVQMHGTLTIFGDPTVKFHRCEN